MVLQVSGTGSSAVLVEGSLMAARCLHVYRARAFGGLAGPGDSSRYRPNQRLRRSGKVA